MHLFTRSKLTLSVVIGLVLSGTALVASLVPAQADTWKCYTYMPSPTHPAFVGLQNTAKALDKISGGKVNAQCSVGGSLPIKSDTIAQAVSDGVLNLASSGFDTGYVPVGGLFSVPGLFATEDELEKGYQAALPMLQAEFASRNIVLLGAYHYPRQVIWSTTELRSVDDLKGVKMRANSPENAEFIKRFGGIPVTMATPDVAPALQRGVFSSVITAAAGAGQLWIDMLPYMVDVGPSYTVSFIIVDKPSFDSLTDAQQQALRSKVATQTAWISSQMTQQNEDLLSKFTQNGFKIAPSNPEEEKKVADVMKPYWDQWATQRGENAKAALDAARKAIGK